MAFSTFTTGPQGGIFAGRTEFGPSQSDYRSRGGGGGGGGGSSSGFVSSITSFGNSKAKFTWTYQNNATRAADAFNQWQASNNAYNQRVAYENKKFAAEKLAVETQRKINSDNNALAISQLGVQLKQVTRQFGEASAALNKLKNVQYGSFGIQQAQISQTAAGKIQQLEFQQKDLGFKLQELDLEKQGLGIQSLQLDLKASNLGLQIQGLGIQQQNMQAVFEVQQQQFAQEKNILGLQNKANLRVQAHEIGNLEASFGARGVGYNSSIMDDLRTQQALINQVYGARLTLIDLQQKEAQTVLEGKTSLLSLQAQMIENEKAGIGLDKQKLSLEEQQLALQQGQVANQQGATAAQIAQIEKERELAIQQNQQQAKAFLAESEQAKLQLQQQYEDQTLSLKQRQALLAQQAKDQQEQYDAQLASIIKAPSGTAPVQTTYASKTYNASVSY